MLELQDCLGRIFTKEQLPPELLKKAKRLSSIFEKKGELFCSRCYSQIDKERYLLPIGRAIKSANCRPARFAFLSAQWNLMALRFLAGF